MVGIESFFLYAVMFSLLLISLFFAVSLTSLIHVDYMLHAQVPVASNEPSSCINTTGPNATYMQIFPLNFFSCCHIPFIVADTHGESESSLVFIKRRYVVTTNVRSLCAPIGGVSHVRYTGHRCNDNSRVSPRPCEIVSPLSFGCCFYSLTVFTC